MRLLKSPALHMLALGGLMFGVTLLRGAAGFGERPQIVVAPHRLDLTLQSFIAENRRAATPQERQEILDALIDQEVLYNYALTLGMHEHPAAQRRLAQIAEFVEANPHEVVSEAERADTAMDMGLHHGDLVVRRILIDSAKRLIRAVVLLQEPSPDRIKAYLSANEDTFRRPARSRITHVAVNGFKWPDTETRAQQLLARIQSEELDLEAAVALGDESFVPSRLPPLTEKALGTKFGFDFASAVIDLPADRWKVVASRYGHHLVYVHERFEAHVPPLAEIRDSVKERLLHKLADEWLALRLKELRLEFDIVAPTTSPS